MRVPPGTPFVAGLLLGAAIAWLAQPTAAPTTVLGWSPDPQGPVAPDEPRTIVSLDGRGGPTPSLPEEAPEDPEAPRARMTPETLALLGEFEAQGLTDEAAARAGWKALATLYALAGREEDLFRVLGFAFQFDAATSEVLEAVGHLPAARLAGALDRLLATWPAADWAWSALADLYLRVGQRRRAAEVLRNAVLAAEVPDGDLLRALVRAEPSTAAALLERLMIERNWGAETVSEVAYAFSNEGAKPAARPFFLRALELSPDDDSLLQTFADVDLGAALAHAEARALRQPDDAMAQGTLAGLRMRAGDAKGAFAAYLEAARINPDTSWLDGMLQADPKRALPLIAELTAGSVDDEAVGTLADALLLAGDRKAAVDVYLQALDLDPEDSEWLRKLVDLDPALAAQHMGATIDANPEGAGDELLGAHAKALLALGKRGAAFDRFLEAHRKDQGDYEWNDGMARSDPARALEILEAEREEGRDDSTLYGALGSAYGELGRREEALENLERALEHDNSATWYRALARLDGPRAVRRLRAAVAANPQNDELWGALGHVCRDLGRTQEARDAYRRALELDPTDEEWRTELAPGALPDDR